MRSEFIKIGSAVKISKGNKADYHTGNQANGELRFIQIDDLRNDSGLKFTSDRGVVTSEKDVIIAWDGANAGTVGYGISGIIGSTLAKLEITNPKIATSFLGYFLQTKSKYLRERSTGATIPHISKQVLCDLEIPLLSLEEQKRIVNILDKTNILRKKRKEAISLLDDYLRSVLMEILTEHKEVDTTALGELLSDHKGSIRTGPFGSDLKHSEFVDSGISVLGIDNVVNNRFEWAKKRFISAEKYNNLKLYTVFPRDVLITIMGTTGRTTVVPDDIPLAINTKHLVAMTFDKTKANPYFMSYSMQVDPLIKGQIARQEKGAIMGGLNMGIIKNLNFPKIPISSQNKFEEIYHSVQKTRHSMILQSKNIETQFHALMQGSFRQMFD